MIPAATAVVKNGVYSILDQVYEDPGKNLPKLMDWADKFANGKFPAQRAAIRSALTDPGDPYHKYVKRLIRDVDEEVMKTLAVNFFINANMVGEPVRNKLKVRYKCNIPWTILMDPTTACNLRCKGCWAADYGYKMNLTFDEMDSVVQQGKELGIYFFMFTGGEPLLRHLDIIRLCEKHSDCVFSAFTNGTLLDSYFADEMLRVKNFVPAISLEGFEKTTNARRGSGVYETALGAMKMLKRKRLPFGVSCCYTSDNYRSLTSSEYWDMMIKNGASFVWYFHYMPVGNDADINLLPTPEQRAYVFQRIRRLRTGNPLFAIDFQNDGEFVGGCIAGGRSYFHINANGDAEPCVFVHYSNANIRRDTLLDCLRSPLFMEYRAKQPFNDNMLMPCPMLENPDKLPVMVKNSDAHSTDLSSPETVDHLCSKCAAYAVRWKPKADELWERRLKMKRKSSLS